MKQEVGNVGKFSASTPSSASNYLLYSSVESINTLINTKFLKWGLIGILGDVKHVKCLDI